MMQRLPSPTQHAHAVVQDGDILPTKNLPTSPQRIKVASRRSSMPPRRSSRAAAEAPNSSPLVSPVALQVVTAPKMQRISVLPIINTKETKPSLTIDIPNQVRAELAISQFDEPSLPSGPAVRSAQGPSQKSSPANLSEFQLGTRKARGCGFEDALSKYPHSILACILDYLNYQSFRPLNQVSSILRKACCEGKGKDVILERYLGGIGYRTFYATSSYPVVDISLGDLDAFQTGLEYSLAEYAIFATDHKRKALDMRTLRMIRGFTRAYNKLVNRMRTQPAGLQLIRPSWSSQSASMSIFKSGRAAVLRVWVPCVSQWMTNDEMVECERSAELRNALYMEVLTGDIGKSTGLGSGLC